MRSSFFSTSAFIDLSSRESSFRKSDVGRSAYICSHPQRSFQLFSREKFELAACYVATGSVDVGNVLLLLACLIYHVVFVVELYCAKPQCFDFCLCKPLPDSFSKYSVNQSFELHG